MKHYFQKYGIACMIGLVIFVLILPVQVFAAGEDSSSENNRTEDNMTETDLEKTQEETEQKIWDLTEVKDGKEISPFLGGTFVKIAFRMQIDDLVDSSIMQLYPIDFARKLVETFINTQMANIDEVTEKKPEQPADTDLKFAEDRLRDRLGTKVSIQGSQSKGKVIIEYYSRDELNGIYDILIRE